MIAWLTHLQHARGRNVIFVGILDEKLDDFNRRVFVPQIDGSKTASSCPASSIRFMTLAQIKRTPRPASLLSHPSAAGLPDAESLGISREGSQRSGLDMLEPAASRAALPEDPQSNAATRRARPPSLALPAPTANT